MNIFQPGLNVVPPSCKHNSFGEQSIFLLTRPLPTARKEFLWQMKKKVKVEIMRTKNSTLQTLKHNKGDEQKKIKLQSFYKAYYISH